MTMKTYLRYALCFLVLGFALPNASYAVSPVFTPNSMEEIMSDFDMTDAEIAAVETIKETAKKPKRKKKGSSGGGKMWLWGLIAGLVGAISLVLAVVRAASIANQLDAGDITEEEATSKAAGIVVFWILGVLLFATSSVLLTIWLIQMLMNS